MITVKHRRADDAEWLEFDPVIPDGELALVSGESGYDIKIGDGVRKYSELSPIMGRHIVSDEEFPEVRLRHRDHACYDYVSSVDVTLDTEGHPDYTAMLTFCSPDTDPEISFSPSSIVFSGSDVSDGIFIPKMGTKYTLLFWRDTELNCHARGAYVG